MFRLSIQRVGSVLQNRFGAHVAKNGKFYLIILLFYKIKNFGKELRKIRENTGVQYYFGVFNFDFTRKKLEIYCLEKLGKIRENDKV